MDHPGHVTANLFLFLSVPFSDFQYYLRFSLCHNFPFTLTITIHDFDFHHDFILPILSLACAQAQTTPIALHVPQARALPIHGEQ